MAFKPFKFLGKLAKIAAIPASFVNPLLGAGLMAGGGALVKGKKAKFFKDIVGPGAATFGLGKLSKIPLTLGAGGASGIAGGKTGGQLVGDLASTLGKAALKNPLQAGTVALGANEYFGAQKQQKRLDMRDSKIDEVRNQILQRLLAHNDYNF